MCRIGLGSDALTKANTEIIIPFCFWALYFSLKSGVPFSPRFFRAFFAGEKGSSMGRFPSGQREQTVNLSPDGFGGSNPPLPTILR